MHCRNETAAHGEAQTGPVATPTGSTHERFEQRALDGRIDPFTVVGDRQQHAVILPAGDHLDVGTAVAVRVPEQVREELLQRQLVGQSHHLRRHVACDVAARRSRFRLSRARSTTLRRTARARCRAPALPVRSRKDRGADRRDVPDAERFLPRDRSAPRRVRRAAVASPVDLWRAPTAETGLRSSWAARATNATRVLVQTTMRRLVLRTFDGSAPSCVPRSISSVSRRSSRGWA